MSPPATPLMLVRLCLFATFAIAVRTATADALPERLALEYDLARNGTSIGEVSRTLQRQNDGHYRYTTWTRATGFTRLLSKTEWRESGEFAVTGAQVRPRYFSETRSGDKRAYEYRVTIDRAQLRFDDGRIQPLTQPVLDQGSTLYALMLSPPDKSAERLVAVTDGKDVDTYQFLHRGNERMETVFGAIETIVISRVKPAQLDMEARCRANRLPPAECLPDDLTFWLMPAKGNIPVKIERRRKDEITTLTLREARGLDKQ